MDPQMQVLAELLTRLSAAEQQARDIEYTLRGEFEKSLKSNPAVCAAQQRKDELAAMTNTVAADLFSAGDVLLSSYGEFNVIEKLEGQRVHVIQCSYSNSRLRQWSTSMLLAGICTMRRIEDTALIEDKKMRRAVEKCIVKIRMKGW